MDLSSTTTTVSSSLLLQRQQEHEAVLQELAAKKVAAEIIVPTLPDQVRESLRQLGLPVRLFGENLANVRDRLRMELARRRAGESLLQAEAAAATERAAIKTEDEEQVTKYTRAGVELVTARQEIAVFSLQRAAGRLERERRLRSVALKRKRGALVKPDPELTRLDQDCVKLFKNLRQVALEGSQYGDSRVLSCICAQQVAGVDLVATGSWTGNLSLWNAGSSELASAGRKSMCHEDRIMGIAMMTPFTESQKAMQEQELAAMIATTSIDLTAKLWSVRRTNDLNSPSDKDNFPMQDTENSCNTDEDKASGFTITEAGCLKGHAARLCRVAFHPMKKHVATTSFDHSWRLWDIETSQNILLQDGHWKETYGIGFHKDGSLVSTTDFGGVVQVWDLRTGKSVASHCAHAKRVLNAEFSPNGFQLVTAGDDGTMKVFDLRRRKIAASIPAHSNLITTVRFDPTGEFLVSSSFDGTAKVWACRNWKLVRQLLGHEGKLTGVDILADNQSLVTAGFDKTLKLWR